MEDTKDGKEYYTANLSEQGAIDVHDAPLEALPKSRWERLWPVIAAGSGLFSDGYLNGVCRGDVFLSRYANTYKVIGSVNTMLKEIYGTAYTSSHAQSNVASIAFAGTVVGHLFFGILSDYWSRKNALLTSTLVLILFAALCAGSYGANDNVQGLFACLVAFRFLLGIGIGGKKLT